MLAILEGINFCQSHEGWVRCDPGRPRESTRSPPTFPVLYGLVPIDALDRRGLGEISRAPHIRIDRVLDWFPTPGVLDGNLGCEPRVAFTPGEADIADHMSARHFETAVKPSAQESRFPLHDRIEWRPWRETGVNRVWVRRSSVDESMDKCVHSGERLKGEPWVYHRVVPVSSSRIENELVISDRPRLHTADVAVIDRSVKGILPNRAIIEARPKGELSLLEFRMRRGGVSTGPTSREDVILGSVEDGRFRDQKPFFPPTSVRRELGSVSGGRFDLVREVQSNGPRTIVNDRRDADAILGRTRRWVTGDEGEDSGQGEQKRQKYHFVGGGSEGLV